MSPLPSREPYRGAWGLRRSRLLSLPCPESGRGFKFGPRPRFQTVVARSTSRRRVCRPSHYVLDDRWTRDPDDVHRREKRVALRPARRGSGGAAERDERLEGVQRQEDLEML